MASRERGLAVSSPNGRGWGEGKRRVRTVSRVLLAVCGLAAAACRPAAPTAALVPTLILPTPYGQPTQTSQPVLSGQPSVTSSPPYSPSPSPTFTPVPVGTVVPSPSSLGPPTATPAFDCQGAPPPRLQVGQGGRVTYTTGEPVRVREHPEVDSHNVLFQISEGTVFTVIGGPMCVSRPDGSTYVFWQIALPGRSATGWVAEGEWGNYYLEPWEE